MHYHACSFFIWKVRVGEAEKAKKEDSATLVWSCSTNQLNLRGASWLCNRGYVNLQTAIPHSPVNPRKFIPCKRRILIMVTPVKRIHCLFWNLYHGVTYFMEVKGNYFPDGCKFLVKRTWGNSISFNFLFIKAVCLELDIKHEILSRKSELHVQGSIFSFWGVFPLCHLDSAGKKFQNVYTFQWEYCKSSWLGTHSYDIMRIGLNISLTNKAPGYGNIIVCGNINCCYY